MKCINVDCDFNISDCNGCEVKRLKWGLVFDYCKHYIPEPKEVDLYKMLDSAIKSDVAGGFTIHHYPLYELLKALIDRKES